MAVTTRNQRRQPARTPRASLKPARRKQRDTLDANSAYKTRDDIAHVLGREIQLTEEPQEHNLVFTAQIGPVELIIVPANSRVHLKAEGLALRVLQTAPDGEMPLGSLEQLVAYFQYAGVQVPGLRLETLPDFARIQLLEACKQPAQWLELEQRPKLSLVPQPPEPPPADTPSAQQPPNLPRERPRTRPGNRGRFATI